ncbi:MAG: tRNA (adenosine(37)-N6)-threonylcarbamoyltransferase complex ATPase subunit type 1 TsaE [Patescibacteria group bacterium]
MKSIITNNESETLNLAQDISKRLSGGDLVGLKGNLGSGKTIFAKGLARGLGIKETVQSPTFVIMMLYRLKTKTGQAKKVKYFCHIDAYRISPKDLIAIGASEFIRRQDTITIIEWADKLKGILPKKTKWIEIIQISQAKRKIKFNF